MKLAQFSSVSTVSFFTSSKPLSVAGEDALLAIGWSLSRPISTDYVINSTLATSALATMKNMFIHLGNCCGCGEHVCLTIMNKHKINKHTLN